MQRFKKLLVGIDTGESQHPALEHAVDLAAHLDASLTIVATLRDFTWFQQHVTVRDHKHAQDLLIEGKQQQLEALAEPIRQQGIEVVTKVLVGETSVEMIREVLRDDYDLVVHVTKGAASRRVGFFGTTAFKLLRKCPCPVWLVLPSTAPAYEHVMACVDTPTDGFHGELNTSIMELAASISHYEGGRYSVVHAWNVWGEQILHARMRAEEIHELHEARRIQAQHSFDDFLDEHGTSPLAENVHLLDGEAAEVIPAFASSKKVDLVIMGTVARSGVSGLIMGNMAEQLLNRLSCAVLAVKPSSFISPIKLPSRARQDAEPLPFSK